MISDQKKRPIEVEPDMTSELRAIRQIHANEIVEARRANDEDAIRCFAQLNDTPAEFVGCNEMQMRELRDGVTQGVVYCPFRYFSTVDMSERYAHQGRGRCGRESFKAISQQHDNVRLQALVAVGKTRKAYSSRSRDVGRSIAGKIHGHLAVHSKAVAADQVHRMPECLLEMHRGCNDLQLAIRRSVDCPHQPAQKAIFGPRSGYDADPPSHAWRSSVCENRVDEAHGAQSLGKCDRPTIAAQCTRHAFRLKPKSGLEIVVP